MTKLTPPNWAPHAVPTVRGWHHPITGELLASRNHIQEDVDAFHSNDDEGPVMLNEAPISNKDLTDMNDVQKEALNEVSGLKGVMTSLFERK